jgi:hypothetical protein
MIYLLIGTIFSLIYALYFLNEAINHKMAEDEDKTAYNARLKLSCVFGFLLFFMFFYYLIKELL